MLKVYVLLVAVHASICDPNHSINEAIGYWKNIFQGSTRFLKNVSNDDVSFTLYNKNFDTVSVDTSLENAGFFLPDVEIKFVVHGWGESRFRPYYRSMTDEYMRRGDYNVVHVDWSKAARAEYNVAVENTYKVGKILGQFVAKLITTNVTTHDNVHLLGHSLGAHVVGVAGKEIYTLTGTKIQRITGLDPAGPSFEMPAIEVDKRLDKDDAEMVDVVHTDGGVFGFIEPIGTLDFYPNGGMGLQPSCSLFKISVPPTFRSATDYAFCSHTRSYIYYITSINSKIVAVQCDSWKQYRSGACDGNENILFGEDAPSTATGTYYLRMV